MSKHNRVPHPNGQQGYAFATFPAITSFGLNFPQGPIHLLHGEHRGPNRGFGLAHIAAAHGHQLQKQYPNIPGIEAIAIQYVSDLLSPGTPIYCEFNGSASTAMPHPYSVHKSTVVNNAKGSVVLELRLDGQNNHFYSVVTAFNRRHGLGTAIGRLI